MGEVIFGDDIGNGNYLRGVIEKKKRVFMGKIVGV